MQIKISGGLILNVPYYGNEKGPHKFHISQEKHTNYSVIPNISYKLTKFQVIRASCNKHLYTPFART